MFRHNPIAAFLFRFLVLYLLLALPWPGVDWVYGVCFRAMARMVFAGRSGWAIFWGMFCYHCCLLLALDFVIWTESAEISLVSFTPFWKHATDGIRENTMGQIGLGVPIVIWMLVTYLRPDFSDLERPREGSLIAQTPKLQPGDGDAGLA